MTRREIKRMNRNRAIGWFLLGVGWTATAMLIALLPLVYN
jgi:hypothetical protein